MYMSVSAIGPWALWRQRRRRLHLPSQELAQGLAEKRYVIAAN